MFEQSVSASLASLASLAALQSGFGFAHFAIRVLFIDYAVTRNIF
jgi:hypothetical protein